MKTAELTGTALNSAVMSCEGLSKRLFGDINYSGDWSHGGPIIEREWIDLHCVDDSLWTADCSTPDGLIMGSGPTPLIAAMRCYVASKLGDQIDIPTELMEGK